MDNLVDKHLEINTPKNASIELYLSEDKQLAYITISLPENNGDEISEQQIYDFLSQNNIVFGIDKKEIQNIVLHKIYDTQILIARGQPSEDGKNGWIEYHFEKNNFGKAREKADGSVDFKDLGLITNVLKDQVLCTIHSRTDEQNGMNVLGTPIIAKKGRSAKNPQSTNTYLSEDGKTLLAGLSGQVICKADMVSISEIFTVNGNIDNAVGNLAFNGKLVIKGDVLSGFSVSALGDIEIYGVVESAIIKSGGNIILHSGMNGVGKGILAAQESIRAKYIENTTVSAKGDISAQMILNCNIKCEGNLELETKKGLIAGGICVVAKNLISNSIGLPSNIKTHIVVGVSVSLNEEIIATKKLIATLQKEILQITQVTEYLQPLLLAGEISTQRLEILKSTKLSKVVKLSQKSETEKKLEKLNEKLSIMKQVSIICKGKIHTGTKVEINGVSLSIKDEIVNSKLYVYENKIIIAPIV